MLSTGMGETASDFLAHRLGPLPAVALTGSVFVVALALQLRARRYAAPLYWFAVIMISVFGTLAADAVHVGFGVPYWVSTLGFLLALGVIFTLWQRSEGTLSIHSVTTRRRELFYWATVLATFALGTAAGDFTARTLGLGWLTSGLLFAALMALPVLARVRFKFSPVLAFWWAYVITRPVGASFADWMAVPHSQGGLGWGTGAVTLGLCVLILVFVLTSAVHQGRSAARGEALAPTD
ncbi:integral membrane protein [Deinococcus marmoris]|uniref:Integral membrane protein n=1 Tax=Deinococcus marmoris TaxID=249408 RepID=A0A1U7P377_9DEIO|nr:integral membrane protein [Deinococcus marmoris]